MGNGVSKQKLKKLSINLQGEEITRDIIKKLKQRYLRDPKYYTMLTLDFKNGKKLVPQPLLNENWSKVLEQIDIDLSGITPNNLDDGNLFDKPLVKVEVVSISFNSMEVDVKTSEFFKNIIENVKNASTLRLEIREGKIHKIQIHQMLNVFENLKRVTLLDIDISKTSVRWEFANALNKVGGMAKLILKSEESQIDDATLRKFLEKLKISELEELTLKLKGNRFTKEALMTIEKRILLNTKNSRLKVLYLELDIYYENTFLYQEEVEIFFKTSLQDLKGQILVNDQVFPIKKVQERSFAKEEESLSNQEMPFAKEEEESLLNQRILFAKEEESLSNQEMPFAKEEEEPSSKMNKTASTADTKSSKSHPIYDEKDDKIKSCGDFWALKVNKAIILGLSLRDLLNQENGFWGQMYHVQEKNRIFKLDRVSSDPDLNLIGQTNGGVITQQTHQYENSPSNAENHEEAFCKTSDIIVS